MSQKYKNLYLNLTNGILKIVPTINK